MVDDGSERIRNQVFKLVDLVVRLTFPVLLGMAGWTWTMLADHESRIHFIEQTRYTATERDHDRNDIDKQLRELSIQQAVANQQMISIIEAIRKMETTVANNHR